MTCKAEQIALSVNDADQAETYASIEAVGFADTRQGSQYTFADGSALIVKGMAMRWVPSWADAGTALPAI